VHFGHDPIPLCFWVITQQFAKEIISLAREGALSDLGFFKLCFSSNFSYLAVLLAI
jgi:hypothetical protein